MKPRLTHLPCGLLALLFTFLSFHVSGQGDCLGNWTISTQAEVDGFDCSFYDGNITIIGEDITNLNGMSELREIDGHLNISTTGLSNLNGLENLETISTNLYIGGNVNLTSASLPKLEVTDRGYFWLEDNMALENIDFPVLNRIGFPVSADSSFNVQSLRLNGNDALTILGGFSALTSIGNNFYINDNQNLTTIHTFENLNTIGGNLQIQDNPNLSDCCEVQPILSLSNNISGDIIIEDNLLGCSSEEGILLACEDEVMNDCNLDDCPTTPISLNTWTQTGPIANGNWAVSDEGQSVFQSINGDPTFFVSPDDFINTSIRGSFRVATSTDDDLIGFVFGYQSPNSNTGDYNFILFDWKQTSQSASGYGFAPEGFSLSRINGNFANITELRNVFWQKISHPALTVLDTNFADNGWADNTMYNFRLDYFSNNIKIYIDDNLIFDVNGNFPSGKFGFYNYSQPNVEYMGFSEAVSCVTFYADTDGDGFGDANNTTEACTAPEDFVANNNDCDDTNPNINIQEDCTLLVNGTDENCNQGNDLLAYYTFDGNANDESDNNHNATVNNGVTLTTDRNGNANSAYAFNGNGAIEVTENTDDFRFNNRSITISTWVTLADNNNDYEGYVSIGNSGVGIDLYKRRSGLPDGNIAYLHRVGSNLNIANSILPGDELPLNEWLHLVGVTDAESQEIKLYINGELQETSDLTLDYDFTNQSNFQVLLGQRAGVSTFAQDGNIDDVRIYNRALSTAEIQELYNCEKPTTTCTITSDLIFSTQAELDAFDQNCTILDGNLIINGDDITDLSNLINLQKINGSVIIGDTIQGNIGNDLLENLNGLGGITDIGGDLIICQNPVLTSLSGFNMLMSVGGDILVKNCIRLESLNLIRLGNIGGDFTLSGLSFLIEIGPWEWFFLGGSFTIEATGLSSFVLPGSTNVIINGDFYFINNPNLTEIDVTNLIQLLGCFHVINNTLIEEIPDLSNLEIIGEDIRIIDNDLIDNVDNLSSLTTVNGSLIISENDLLENLDGLSSLLQVGDTLMITNNPTLNNCCGIYDLLNGDGVGGFIDISGNPSECSSDSEVLETCPPTIDNDNDGFSAAEDCDDNNPNINPDATEISGNNIDENCDGIAEDMDDDGFDIDEDCDDNNPSVNPNASEVAGNGVDDNCNGMVDEPLSPCDFDNPFTDLPWLANIVTDSDDCITSIRQTELDGEIVFVVDYPELCGDPDEGQFFTELIFIIYDCAGNVICIEGFVEEPCGFSPPTGTTIWAADCEDCPADEYQAVCVNNITRNLCEVLCEGIIDFTMGACESDPETCDDLTDGGEICCSQVLCGGNTDPEPFTNISLPTGGTVDSLIEYLWIYTYMNPDEDPFQEWQVYANSNTAEFDLDNVTQTTWVRRCARRAGCHDYLSESNIVQITIEEECATPCANFALSGESFNTSCQGNDGQIELTVTGTNSNVTFLWEDDEITQNRDNVSPGTYNVTATNEEGCVTTASVEVVGSEGLEIDTNESIVFSTFCDGINGGIELFVKNSMGDMPVIDLFYLWNDGGTTKDRSSLVPANYSVTVSDEFDCTAVADFEVEGSEGLQTELTVIPATCNSAAEINLTVSNNISDTLAAGLLFEWSDGATSEDRTDLQPGVYSVTVSNDEGCAATSETVTISDIETLIISTDISPETCTLNDGAIDITITGGSGNYSYLWNNGASTEDLTNLTAGEYKVVVTDNSSGCVSTAEVTVSLADCPPTCDSYALEITNVTGLDCNGNLGAIDLTFTDSNNMGEMIEVSYLWNDGTTTEDRSDLEAGTYSLIATIGDCVFNAEITLEEPDCPVSCENYSLEITNVTGLDCNGNLGAIDLTFTNNDEMGGMPLFDPIYNWSDGAITEDRNDLAAGVYGVMVTVGDCIFNAEITLDEPDCGINCADYTLEVVNTSPVDCDGNLGTIDIAFTGNMGDMPDVDYVWSDGATTKDRNDLEPGVYTVWVVFEDCTYSAEITLAELDCGVNCEDYDLELIDVSPIDCDGNLGAISLSFADNMGDMPDVDFVWSDGATTKDRTDLSAGVYSVMVAFENCTYEAEVTLTAPTCAEEENTLDACSDGVDNDLDGLVDEEDPDCDVISFDCSVGFYHIISGQLNIFDIENEEFIPIGEQHQLINAIGYNVEDDLIYGIQFNTRRLVRLDAIGRLDTIGIVEGLPIPVFAGDFDFSGNLHVLDNDTGRFYRIDVDAEELSAEEIAIEGNIPELNDIAYNHNDQTFYGLRRSNADLYAIDLSTNTVSNIPTSNISQSNGYGAVFFTGDGTFYAYGNSTGRFYTVDLETGEGVQIARGPSNGNNDGASCGNILQFTDEPDFQFLSITPELLPDNSIRLRWTTIGEADNGYHIVRHGADSLQFRTKSDIMDGKGSSNEVQVYEWTDASPRKGMNYYRVRHLDANGQDYFSTTVVVYLANSDGAFLAPNPTMNMTTLDFIQPLEKDTPVILYNSLGQAIRSLMIPVGTIRHEFDLTEELPGMYHVYLKKYNKRAKVLRLVKARL